MPITNKMPSFSGVAAGSTATASYPVGLTYRGLGIRYKINGTNATEAQLAALGVVLKIDGDEKINLSGADLLALYKYHGNPVQAGVLPIVFARSTLRSARNEDATAYGTEDVSSMVLEITIPSGVTNPSLETFAEQSAGSPLGQHITVKSFSRSISATGEFEEANLPKGTSDKPRALVGLHLTTDDIDRFEVIINSNNAMKEDVETAKFLDGLKGREKTWQTGYTHIVPTRTNRLSDAIPLNVQDYRVLTNHTATGSFKYLHEVVEQHRPSR